MRVDDFIYDLPPELIAQHPPERRDGGRLMVLDRGGGGLDHRAIVDLPELVEPGTVMVINDSRVIPARLWARRATGGRVELLLLERQGPTEDGQERWACMLRASKTPQAGERLELLSPGLPARLGRLRGVASLLPSAPSAFARVLDRPVHGRCQVAIAPGTPERLGQTPLPPYIRREGGTLPEDHERYQTVYAREDGSVAAPTAGLHLTEALLAGLRDRGVEVCRVTLHVGPGTFQPVRCERIADHRMEEERFEVPEETAAAIARARAAGRPVLAVGTTVVRTLEATGGEAGTGRTDLFITPGHRFQVVDRLLTNFHLPGSTLLMLVSALAGRERILAAYAEAVEQGYRFYSYGDAMLIG
jgi:S-adenosylmethionine:tRNA ribosyltransferase-isomerase